MGTRVGEEFVGRLPPTEFDHGPSDMARTDLPRFDPMRLLPDSVHRFLDRAVIVFLGIAALVFLMKFGKEAYWDNAGSQLMQTVARSGAGVKYFGGKQRRVRVTIPDNDMNRFEDGSWPGSKAVADLSKMTWYGKYSGGVDVWLRDSSGQERYYCSVREGNRYYPIEVDPTKDN